MKLWVVRPRDLTADPWYPLWDKALGFVVRAPDENTARELADRNASDESAKARVWLDHGLTSCEELVAEGDPVVIMISKRDG